MTTKLIQKSFLKGSREFEIADDAVSVRVKGLLKEQNLTIGLSRLNPEPQQNGSELVFCSSAKGEPVFSILLNQPSEAEFNTFVNTLRQGILAESGDNKYPSAPGWNVYEEPSAFNDEEEKTTVEFQPVNPDRLEEDMTMLKSYLDVNDIQSLLETIDVLKSKPNSEAALQDMIKAFNDLGLSQGAVLTYAPYLKVLLSRYAWA